MAGRQRGSAADRDPWLLLDSLHLRRLDDTEREQVNPAILIPFNIMAVGVLLLQVYNLFALQEAWPVFLAFVVAISGAFQQFILLVRMGFGD